MTSLATRIRRTKRATRVARLAATMFALLAAGLATRAASATAWQPHEDMQRAAVAAALANQTGENATASADRPDPRLRLARCDRPLDAKVSGPARLSGRVTAEVSCPGSRPWRMFLPVMISSTRATVVAARPLARDAVLAPDDIRLATLDPALQVGGTFGDLELAVGQRLRRAVDEGTPLTPALLSAPVLIRRGQEVTIEAQSKGFAVRMTGVARTDGTRGELIEVENGVSGRVVEAVVRSPRSVEVLLR